MSVEPEDRLDIVLVDCAIERMLPGCVGLAEVKHQHLEVRFPRDG